MKYDPEDWENYDKGIRYFNRQKFFEAHEAWEEIWRRTTDTEDKRFLQGLIQAAAFLVHHQRGNGRSAVKLYHDASEKLASYQRGYWGADIRKLLDGLQQAREKIEKGEEIKAYPRLFLLKKLEETP
ncbi:MAG: DUF309 domain-containing protein [Candidatus Omnitrophica bacterium]|nr:DUF309 domain-containing protein [Candidatus Omnitrophota bacterium]